METEIVLAGVGGQGVITAGMIIAEIALAQGQEVTWMPAYGAEMRGGKAYSVVKVSSEMIASPDVEDIDILIALSPRALEFEPRVKKDGLLIVNTHMIPEEVGLRSDVKVLRLDCDRIANEFHNSRAASIYTIGALVAITRLYTMDAVIQGISDYFTDRGKASYVQSNIDVCLAGYRVAIDQVRQEKP